MMLEHAIYGSASGLGDYRVLAASAGLDESARTKISYYSSLGASALSGEFAPIFCFFALNETSWAFTRTVYAGATTRGSEYVVHAIVVGKDALAQFDYKPFALADAGLFVSQKPPKDSVLPPLDWQGGETSADFPAQSLPAIAFSLRALSRGSLRLRVADPVGGAGLCRAVHESLPPDDRLVTTFCTRFSYRRALEFRFAAFVDADESIVREQANPEMFIATLPAKAATPGDLYDRWVSEVYRQPELELVGLSLLNGPAKALALVENVRILRQWTEGATSAFELDGLRDAAQLVLQRENKQRAAVRPLVPGAAAVNLCHRVERALAAGKEFDECIRVALDIGAEVRERAAHWIGQLSAPALAASIAELFFLLPDAPLNVIIAQLAPPDGSRPYFAALSTRASSPFLLSVLLQLRQRFGIAAMQAAITILYAVAEDGDTAGDVVEAIEHTAPHDEDLAFRRSWLITLVQAVVQRPSVGLPIAARIALEDKLLPLLTEPEIRELAPALYAVPDKLAPALAEENLPVLHAALAQVAYRELLHRRHRRSRSAIEVLGHVMVGAASAVAGGTTDDVSGVTALLFLASHLKEPSTLAAIRVWLSKAVAALVRGGVTESQAALLLWALLRARLLNPLDRTQPGAAGRIGVPRRELAAVRGQARTHHPANPWSERRQLRSLQPRPMEATQ